MGKEGKGGHQTIIIVPIIVIILILIIGNIY